MNLLKGTFPLKVLSLVLAVLTYAYVHYEIRESARKAPDPSYKLIKLTSKSLPVNVRLATAPPEGYRLISERVAPTPAQIIVIGPEALLEEASSAETALVDISESTKTVVKRIPLESVAGIHIVGDPYDIEVTVPIEKIEEPKPETGNTPVPNNAPAEAAAAPAATNA